LTARADASVRSPDYHRRRRPSAATRSTRKHAREDIPSCSTCSDNWCCPAHSQRQDADPDLCPLRHAPHRQRRRRTGQAGRGARLGQGHAVQDPQGAGHRGLVPRLRCEHAQHVQHAVRLLLLVHSRQAHLPPPVSRRRRQARHPVSGPDQPHLGHGGRRLTRLPPLAELSSLWARSRPRSPSSSRSQSRSLPPGSSSRPGPSRSSQRSSQSWPTTASPACGAASSPRSC